MFDFLNRLFSKKPAIPIKVYNGITGRCWVCGELLRIYCWGPHEHTKQQKKNQLKVLKSLGYNSNLPSVD